MVENFIGGQEVQVAVLNGKALGAIELIPKRKFYDYKAKYFRSAKTNHIMPANVSNKKYMRYSILQKKHIKFYAVKELRDQILNTLKINFIFLK